MAAAARSAPLLLLLAAAAALAVQAAPAPAPAPSSVAGFAKQHSGAAAGVVEYNASATAGTERKIGEPSGPVASRIRILAVHSCYRRSTDARYAVQAPECRICICMHARLVPSL